MQLLVRRSLIAVSLSTALVLTACGGGGGGGGSTASEPTAAATNTPEPTRTPRPTATPRPTEEPKPTEEPTEAPSSDSSTATGELQEVTIGDLTTYEFPTGLFSIDIPEDWSFADNSNPDEAIIVWTDPSENAAVIVDIYQTDQEYTAEELTDILREFLDQSFSAQPDFVVEDPQTQSDGSVLLVWGYTATADNDVQARLTGNSFVEQRGDKVSILTTLVPKDQFDALLDGTNTIINSYRINPDAAVSAEGGSSSGGPSSGSSDTGSATSGSTETGTPPDTIVAVGEAVETGNLSLTVNSVEESQGKDFATPTDGNKFIILDLSFTNSGSAPEVVSTILMMSLLDAENNKYTIDIMAMTLGEKTADGEVPAGGELTGVVGFQVPEGLALSDLTFVFEPLINGSPVGVQLN